MEMEVALDSDAKVREVLEMLEIIDSTRFQDLPDAWRDRKIRSIDYHSGPIGRGADYVYYDPWRRE